MGITRGRPPLPVDKKRSVIVRVRLTEQQFQRVQKGAALWGISISAWVQMKLLPSIGE